MNAQQQSPQVGGPKRSTVFAVASTLVIFLVVYGLFAMAPTLQASVRLAIAVLAAIFLRLCAIHETLRGR